MKMVGYIINDIIQFFKIIAICELMFRYKRDKSLRNNVLSLVAFAICICIVYNAPAFGIKWIAYAAMVFGIIRLLYHENGIVTGLWMIFVIAIIDSITTLLVEIVIYKRNFSMPQDIAGSILTLAFIIVAAKILNKNENISLKDVPAYKMIIFLIITGVDAMALVLLGDYIMNDKHIIHRTMYLVMVVIVILSVLVLLILVLEVMVSRDNHLKREQLSVKYLGEQVEQYKYLEQREEETKKFRHDIRNHMHMINSFLNEKNYAAVEEYMKAMDVKIESIGNKLTVYNGIVDAVINRYQSEALKEGVSLEVKGRFPVESRVSAFDLCTIFSNLIENAIRGQKEYGEGSVHIECAYNEDEILICIENDYVGELEYRDGRLKTTKRDISRHGIGLLNVERCVEDNGGLISIDTDNNKFKVMVSLVYENSDSR
ncbi:MAG: GHKL domain-containing protein [Lachnospiraceae bacterium]|nr:GHKL domain-containing protein [Lachnospiraceae bacterium]